MSTGGLKDFYNGKTILLTGATGYIGKLMLAKLMRVGNLKEILLLTRAKKGRTNEERLQNILSGFLFEEMEKYDSEFKSKLRIIRGDMELADLGVSFDDRMYVKDNVEIIIHGAATVRFDENLPIAIAINIGGSKQMLEMALEAKKLESFVYISTAYSNCVLKEIDEVFYEPPMDFREALDLLKINECYLNTVTEKLIKPWPNTYTFTKAIAEDMMRQYQDRLPIGVIRPTIVQSTLKDPVRGFTDKIIGPFGITIGIMAGLIRIMKTHENVFPDFIPSDIVVNSVFAIAWEVSKVKKSENEEQVYNCAINSVRKVCIAFGLEYIVKYAKQFPTKKMIWLPRFNQVSSIFMYRLLFVLHHYIPGFFYDIVLRIQGSKTRLVQIYSKIYYQSMLLEYFISRTWKFRDVKMRQLYRVMSEEDHKNFPVNLRAEDYEAHASICTNGIRKYFFKENDEDLKLALKRYKLFYILHNLLLAVIYGFVLYFFFVFVMM